MKIKNILVLSAFVVLATACAKAPAPPAVPVENKAADNTSKINDILAAPDKTAEFADALAIIEYNSHAEDLDFHVELDAPAWEWIAILDPSGNKVFEVSHSGSIGEQGLTSLFFESAELPFDVLPYDEFLARFPEGEYTLVGETLEGEALMSLMTLNHNIPDPPVITSLGEDPLVPMDAVSIAWEHVTSPAGVEVERYQVVVFPVDPEEGQDAIALDIDLPFEVPADLNHVEIPAAWLMSGEQYQYEVIAMEADGNQTLTVGFFTTE